MGLRLKFNLAVVPVVAVLLALVAWADQRHEFAAIMESHAMHAAPVGAVQQGPVDPATLPETVAGRSLRTHIAYGVLLLVMVIGSVNGALQMFVFWPLERMRKRLDRLEHGHWADPPVGASADELGRFASGLDILGLEIGALAGQLLHADRLAIVALLSRHLATRLEPELQTVVQVASELHARQDEMGRLAGDKLARSAAAMLTTTRGFDHLFSSHAHAGTPRPGV
jgi:hypothetical protein